MFFLGVVACVAVVIGIVVSARMPAVDELQWCLIRGDASVSIDFERDESLKAGFKDRVDGFFGGRWGRRDVRFSLTI